MGSGKARFGAAPFRFSSLYGVLAAALLCASVYSATPAFAQQGPTAAPTPAQAQAPLAPAHIDALKEELAAAGDLDDETRAEVLALYEQASNELETARQWREKAEEFTRVVEESPARLAAIFAELEDTPAHAAPDVPGDASLEDLEQQLAQVEARYTAAQEDLAAVDAEMQRRAERRAEVPRLSAEAQGRLSSIDEEQAALAGARSTPVTQGRSILLRAQRQTAGAQLDALDRDIASYTVRGDLLNARRDMTVKKLALAEDLVKSWREIVVERRRRDATAAAYSAEQARRAFESADPELARLAEENAAYAKRRRELAGKLDEVESESEEVSSTFGSVVENFDRVQQKVDAAQKLTRPVSVLLRKQRANLPPTRFHESRMHSRQTLIDDLGFEWLQLLDERGDFTDIDRTAERIVNRVALASPDVERAKLESEVMSLLQSTRDNLRALIGDIDSLLAGLIELAEEERQLVETSTDFREYIDERIIWYNSTEPIAGSDFSETWNALRWLVDPGSWRELMITLGADAWSHPLPYLLFVAGLGALFLLRRRIAGTLRSLSERVLTASTDSFGHTLSALALTVLSAAWAPMLLAFVARRLWMADESPEFARAIAVGLWTAALFLVTTEFLRLSCRENGLADAHFRWRRAALAVFHRRLRWFTVVIVPVAFIVSVLNWQQVNEQWRESVVRIFTIVGLFTIGLFIRRLLRPSGKLMEEILRRRRGGWFERLRVVWYPLAVAVPFVIAFGAALGYQYTAYQLSLRLVYTLWLLLALFFLNAFTLRWLFVAHRKLAVEKALKRRAAEQAPPEAGEAFEEPEIDIFSISAQTRQLIRSLIAVAFLLGVWLIWGNVLPALGFLDRVELWSAGGDNFITLASLVTAAIVAVMTIMAAKNIPGLLEISVLQRLPLDHGVRFAITTVARYIITLFGVIVAFAVIGIGWSKVQWLLAAMTVGLGFGLQEIFGNFISGLIILFERPIRVGDTVTIGNVSGTVTRIQIRATTIRDWDRKELVVPNKEFVTGQLVNWTLSDAILRVVIPVGIAYGSDTEKAHELLLKVARENPNILDDPEPTAMFLGFGDSALKFELRVFIPGIEYYLTIQHDLHMAIDAAFREGDITIAFPQQDVHIKSMPHGLPFSTEPPGGTQDRP